MISIAMTTYNGEKYISAQIDSILSQTVSDFELVVCDDVSTDNTVDILKDYALKDCRLKLCCNGQNLGFKNNFAKAISLCKGEYIAFCDQDDVWTNDHLEVLLREIGENYLIAGNNLLVDENLKPLGITFFESNLFSKKKYPQNIDILKKILLSGNCFQGASMLLSRKILDFYLPLPETIKYHDSWLSALACSLNKFTSCETVITKYRQHDRQVTHNSANLMYIQQRISFFDEIESRNIPLNSDIKSFINQSKLFFRNLNTVTKRLGQTRFWLRHYSYLYPDNNKKRKPLRFLKFVLVNKYK